MKNSPAVLSAFLCGNDDGGGIGISKKKVFAREIRTVMGRFSDGKLVVRDERRSEKRYYRGPLRSPETALRLRFLNICEY